MVVANDVVDTLLFGIGHLFGRFDAAIERDHKAHSLACGVVYTLDRHAITLVITVGNIEPQVVVSQPSEEGVDQRYGRRSVHIVVAINHNLLTVFDGTFDSLHSAIHILHQERIVQLFELRVEESVCFLNGVYASLYKQVRQHRGYGKCC